MPMLILLRIKYTIKYQSEKDNKITEKIEDIAKGKLVVQADNPVESSRGC
ncbi:hypothetical protein ATCC5870_02978 [Lactobacillus plantarum]|nr:hypothetical protein [Lactiplantibacillus plantarum]